MSKLNMFARLVKVDEGKRLVTGLLASETPDLDNEIFDYDSSKPNFQAWSEVCHKASGGKSVGNVRAMHSKVAAGHITEIVMDDAAKTIEITANITDDNEWGKVEKGTYGGFSIGGTFAKKWGDPNDSSKKRYTAKPQEASLVDVPCNLSCTFEVLKANGTDIVLRKFAGGKLEDVSDEASGEGETAASSDSADSQPPAVVLNKAAHSDMLKAIERIPEGPDRDAATEWLNKSFTVNEAEDAPAVTVVEPAPTEAVVTGRLDELCTKMHKLAADEPEGVAATMLKQMFGYDGQPELAKGLCDVSNICDLFMKLGWARDNAKYEAIMEQDGSKVPGMFDAILRTLGDTLIAMVKEEVNEALAKAMGGDADGEEVLRKSLDEEADPAKLRETCMVLAKACGMHARAVAKATGLLKLEKGVSVINGIEKMLKMNGMLETTVAELNKSATDLNKAMKAKDGEIETLKKQMKLPAADPKAPKLKVVGKGGDVTETGDSAGDSLEKVMGANGEPDDAATLIKAAHATGGVPLQKYFGAR